MDRHTDRATDIETYGHTYLQTDRCTQARTHACMHAPHAHTHILAHHLSSCNFMSLCLYIILSNFPRDYLSIYLITRYAPVLASTCLKTHVTLTCVASSQLFVITHYISNIKKKHSHIIINITC